MTLNPPIRDALAAELGEDANFAARSSSGLMSPAKLTLQRLHLQASTSTGASKTTASQNLSEKTPAGKAPAGKASAGETAAGETAAGETADDGTAAGQTPAGKGVAGRIVAGKTAGRVPDSALGLPAKGKPRLLLMGQRRSGKSSISSVVFHKLPPNETLFLESTARIQKDTMASFMDFQVWDFPGQIDVFQDSDFDIDAIFGEVGALIWVIDAQDEYLDAVSRLNATILSLQKTYPNINVEVFIHKVDGLSDDYRSDIQRDITIRIQDEMSDHGFENAPVTFHLTSIYNHSIFEAFSRVIQKLIPRLGTLETMLTNLCRTCRFEKVYLFDVLSKIYIATDNGASDMASYEICSDYIDVIIDITEVYGTWQRSEEGRKRLEAEPWNAKLDTQIGCPTAESCLVLHESYKPIMLREVDRYLALVAIMRNDTYDRMPLVHMNVQAVVDGLAEFFSITKPKSGK